jgi:hypothetical protein
VSVASVSVLLALFVAVLLSIDIGRRIGMWRWAGYRGTDRRVPPTLEAAIFTLMGLLIAFIFYGAGNRFDIRRNLIVQETNAIGTAYLRLDLLPREAQPPLREDFRNYVQSRLEVYRKIPDVEAAEAALSRSAVLQKAIWKKAVAAALASGPAVQSLVLASLNEMIDITNSRTVALRTHPPAAVLVLLAISVIATSTLAGYSMAATGLRDWLFVTAYAFVLGITVFVIIDYEFPRIGLIRIDPVDQVLMKTLEQMQ